MSRVTGVDMAVQFSNWINSAMSYEKEELAKEIVNDHRYIQDEMFGVFFNCIKDWAKMYENGRYDYRNERACKISYEIVKTLKEKGLY